MARKSLRVIIDLSLMALVALGFFAAFSVWRLSQGPVSLDSLTPVLVRNLQPENGAFRVTFDRTVLVWDSDRTTVAIQAQGARAVDKTGKTIAEAPAVQVDFSVGALSGGVVAPTRLVILKPKIRLARKKDGTIDYGGIVESGEKKPETGATPGKFHNTKIFPVLIGEIMREPDTARPLSYLKEVQVLGAEFRIEDRITESAWTARDVNLNLGRDIVGLRVEFNAKLDLGGKPAAISAAGLYSKDQNEINATAGFRRVEPALIGASIPGLEALTFIKVPVNGDFSLVASGDGKIKDLKLALGGAGGTLRLPDKTGREVPVETFKADLQLSPDLRQIELVDLEIRLKDGPTIEAGGAMDVGSTRQRTSLTATIHNIDMATLDRYWPKDMAEGAREWITENVTAGFVPEIQAALSLRHLDGKERNESGEIVGGGATGWEVVYARGALLYSNLKVRYLEGLPPAENVTGHGTFDQNSFKLTIKSGTVEKLAVGPGRMTINGLQDEIQTTDLVVDASGSLSAALRIIDAERLGYAKRIGVKPDDVGGGMAMKLSVSLPLLKDLEIEQVDLGVVADLASVRWPNALLEKEFTADKLQLDLTGKGMTLTGDGVFAGLGINLDWQEDFSGETKFRRELKAGGRIELAEFAKLGFPVAPYITGKAPVKIVYSELRNGTGEVALKTDLTPATINIPELAYEKAPGKVGRATLILDIKDGIATAARDIDMTAPGLALAGTIGFHAETGKVNSADVTRFQFGRTDIKGKLRIDEDGGYRLVVAGPSLDISGFLTPGKETGGADFKLPEIRAEAQIEKLYTRPNRFVGDASLDVKYDGTIWRAIEFSGLLAPTKGEAARIEVSLLPKAGQRTLKIRSADGGAVLNALGLTDDVIGGALRGDGTIDDTKPNRPLTATLRINGFELKNAPAMARLLTLASLEGIAAALNGPGIQFKRLKVPFVLTDDLLVVQDATAIGDDLGFTLKGVLDRKASTVNFAGTIIPSYTLNSLLGNIPVLGQVLVGSKNSGVFAASYTMKGRLAEPDIAVNPLSILAPGVLRILVGGQVDGEALKALPKGEIKDGEEGETAAKPKPKPSGDPSAQQGGRGGMGQ